MIENNKNLSIVDRYIIISFYYDKVSLKDLAKELNMNQSTVTNRKKRALHKLNGDWRLKYWLMENVSGDQYDYTDYSTLKLCICYTCGNSFHKSEMYQSKRHCKLCSWKKYRQGVNEYQKKNKRNVKEYKETWQFYSGDKIPYGWHIHHLDGDHTNNSRDNLVCVSPQMHYEIHDAVSRRYNSSFDKKAAALLKTRI